MAAVGDRLVRTPQANATIYTLIGVAKASPDYAGVARQNGGDDGKNPVQFTM